MQKIIQKPKTRLANKNGAKNIFTRILPEMVKRIDEFLDAEAKASGFVEKRSQAAFFREAIGYYLDRHEKKYFKREETPFKSEFIPCTNKEE